MLRLYRVILPVKDIDQAVSFYSKVLGEDGMRVSPGRHYFDLGGTILACYDPKADGDSLGAGWLLHENQYVYIATTALEKIYKTLKTMDGQFITSEIETMPWGETLFYARDPFGNPICFVDERTIFMGK
ncbi:VOC family protein [Fulvivirga sp. M361]|uniref:VOC family protein n=1 Tax=Fulvivirga sp. M361 TaxID=2594266 RepID=UPI00117A8DF1|nr:VOC family protein [Fulvivirga sp. M361]TRX59070.1 VOC family protein [Fulvivirga sp. M361]